MRIRLDRFAIDLRSSLALLVMLVPGVAYFVVFHYVPMYGVIIAFKDFRLLDGIWRSPWAGLANFRKAFSDAYFFLVLRNTFIISFYRLVVGFPVPIVFALLLNEVLNRRYKKLVQTISFLPHFISWVVLGGVFINLLSLDGPVNAVLKAVGMHPVVFLAEARLFRSILVLSDLWKEFGWGSVIFIATLATVDVEMYEAAIVDGASRFRRAVHISVPSIVPVIVIVLILRMAYIVDAGFDQIFNLYNANVMEVGDIIDTYVYRKGLVEMQYSFSAAVGLSKSLVSLLLITITNRASRLMGGGSYGLW